MRKQMLSWGLICSLLLTLLPVTARAVESSWGGTGLTEITYHNSSFYAMGNNIVVRAVEGGTGTNFFYADASGSAVGDAIDLSQIPGVGGGITGNTTNGFPLEETGLYATYNGTYNSDANAFAQLDVVITMESGTLPYISSGTPNAKAKSITVNMTGGTLLLAHSGSAILATAANVSGGTIKKSLTGIVPISVSGNPQIGGADGEGIQLTSGNVFTITGTLSGASIYVVPEADFADGTVIATAGDHYTITEGDVGQLHLTGSYVAGKELYLEDNQVKIRAIPAPAHSHCVCGTTNCGAHGGETGFTALTALGGALEEGYYYLEENVSANGNIEIQHDVTLCLNGKSLDLSDHFISLYNGGSLTLCDCQATGAITNGSGNSDGNGGAVSIVGDNSSFTMYGGTITGNTAKYGGGVLVTMGGSFAMYGGTITGNTASANGGGVHASNSSFTMTGGTITGNTAQGDGGGVYSGGCTFTVSGAADITGNSTSNVYLGNTQKITIGGQLTGAKIGVTMAHPGVFTDGWDEKMGDAAPADFFTAENSGYNMILLQGEAALHQHRFQYAVDGTNTGVILEICDCGHRKTATVEGPAYLTYDGNAKEVTVRFEAGWAGNQDYSVAYQKDGAPADSAVDAGSYTAQVTLTGTEASAGVNFTIAAKVYNDTDFTIQDIPNQNYNGNEITPEPGIRDGDRPLEKDRDYTLAYHNNIAAGEATVTVTFQGNYSGKATKTFEIVYSALPSDIKNSDIFEDYAVTSGSWITSEGGVTFTTQSGWTVSASPEGPYCSRVTFTEEGEKEQTVYVKDENKKIYKTQISYQLDRTKPTVSSLDVPGAGAPWTGETVTVRFAASDGAPGSGVASVTYAKEDGSPVPIAPGSDGYYSFGAVENGSYTVTVTDEAGNITTEKITIYNIDKTEPTLTISGGETSGTELPLTVTGANSNPNGSGIQSVTVQREGGPIIAILDGSYTITQAGTYTFTATTGAGVAAVVTKTVYRITFDSQSDTENTTELVMDGDRITPHAAPERDGYAFQCWKNNGEVWDFTNGEVTQDLTLTAQWKLDPPMVSLSASPDSSGTYAGGSPVVILTAAASHAVVSGLDYTVHWYKNGKELETGNSDTLSLSKVSDNGVYQVVVTAEDCSGLTAEKSSNTVQVTISKAAPICSVPDNLTATYGDTLSSVQLPEGWSWDDPDTPVGDAGRQSHAATFTPGDTDNYERVETAIPITVGRATLTPSVESVADKVYDGTQSATGTIRLEGAVPGDQPTAITSFTFDSARADTDKTVKVSITLDGKWERNYTLSETELTTKADITPKTVGLIWNGWDNLVYTGQPAGVTATATGLIKGDKCTVTVENGARTDAGTYIAKAIALSNPDYQIPGNVEQSYTIAQLPVKLRWSYTSAIPYDGTARTITAEVENKAGDDRFQLEYSGNTGTAAGAYTAAVTALGNDNYTREGGENLTLNWAIAPKTITGTWMGLDQVYGDGQTVSILLSGLASGDKDLSASITIKSGDTAEPYSSSRRYAAGTYTLTATLDNYIITPATATLEIQKQPVTVTVTGNAAAEGSVTLPEIHAPGLREEDYKVVYRDRDGTEVASPQEPGVYEVWVEITNPNYRFPDGSANKQVGSFTVTPGAPKLYDVNFDGGESANGTMKGLEVAGGSFLTLPECVYHRDGYQFTGWAYGGKIYQPGDQVTAAYSAMTFTAQWQQTTGRVSGGVADENSQPVKDAVVSLWLGATKLRETNTDNTGTYSLSALLPGTYNLVVSRGDQTVTRMVEITGGDVTENFILPKGATNSVVEVAPGSPDIVVGKLETVFSNTDTLVYTQEDQRTVNGDGKVEITFIAEEKQKTEVSEDLQKIQAIAGDSNLALVMDYTLEKTVTTAAGTAGQPTSIPQANVLLEVLLPLPTQLQGKYSYCVYRVHSSTGQEDDKTAQELKQGEANKNNLGEYFTVNNDKTGLTLYVRCFSTYAIGFTEPGGNNGGGSSGGGASAPAYTPTVEHSEYGTIAVHPDSAQKGDRVTITPTPEEGYTVDTVTVTDADGQAVAFTANDDGSYTFIQPAGKVTISVTFRQSTDTSSCPRDERCPIAPFTDADRSAWYHDGVHYCVENGLMVGTGKTTFEPDAAMTRGMLVTILWRLEGSPIVDAPMDYDDVTLEDWYGQAVRWADSTGVVTGYGNGGFGPNDPITREQMAAILWRYAGSPGVEGSLSAFADGTQTSGWAQPAMIWAVNQGLITGAGNNHLEPRGQATRAQAAALLMRFAESMAQ